MAGLSFPQYPPTLPGNTVIGRLGPTPGPSEAVPITTLTGSGSGAISINLPLNSPGSALDITTSGTTQGVNITQNGPNTGDQTPLLGGAGPNFSYNTMTIYDGAFFTTPGFSNGLFINKYITSHSQVTENAALLATNTQAQAANTGGDIVGVYAAAASNFNNGGTNTGAGAKGTLFGGVFSGAANVGTTNFYSVAGGEFECGIQAGASAKYRFGIDITSPSGIQAALGDAAINIASGTGASFNFGIYLSSVAQGGSVAPVSGTLIGTDGINYTLANGIDLSAWTITGNFLNSSSFRVAGAGALFSNGAATFLQATAVPAGGTAGAGIMMSSVANLGVFFGSGAPTLSAAQGSLYLRTDGSTTSTRMYVNTNGSTSWTAVTTAT
jgi:hypothetical protein